MPNALSLHDEFNREDTDEDTLDVQNINPETDPDSIENQLESMPRARSRSLSQSEENDPDDNLGKVENGIQHSPNGSQSSKADQSQRPVRQRHPPV